MKLALLSLLLSLISVYASPSSTLSHETNNFDENKYVNLPNLLESDDCGHVHMETGAPEWKKMENEVSPFNARMSSDSVSLSSSVSSIKQASPSLSSSPVSIESDIKANLEVESDGKADSKVESVLKADIEAGSGQSKLRASLYNLPVSSASSFSDPSSRILEMERIIELERKQKENMEMKMKEIKIMVMVIEMNMKKIKAIEMKMKEMKMKTKETMKTEMETMEKKLETLKTETEKMEKKLEQKRKEMENINLNFSLKSPSSDFSSSSSYQNSLYLSPKCLNRPQFEVIKKYTHSWDYAYVCREHGMVPAEVNSDNIYSAVSAISKAGCACAWIKSWNANSYAGSLILIDPDNTFYLRVDKDIVTYDWLESYNAALCMLA